jgi:hypothetical protein
MKVERRIAGMNDPAGDNKLHMDLKCAMMTLTAYRRFNDDVTARNSIVAMLEALNQLMNALFEYGRWSHVSESNARCRLHDCLFSTGVGDDASVFSGLNIGIRKIAWAIAATPDRM